MPVTPDTASAEGLPEMPSQFVAQCLELPIDGVPHDQEYGTIQCKLRSTASWHAEMIMNFLKNGDLREMLRWCGYSNVTPPDPAGKTRETLWREAVANFIRTPTATRGKIATKQSLLRRRDFPLMPITVEEAKCCIDADEVFFRTYGKRRLQHLNYTKREPKILPRVAYPKKRRAADRPKATPVPNETGPEGFESKREIGNRMFAAIKAKLTKAEQELSYGIPGAEKEVRALRALIEMFKDAPPHLYGPEPSSEDGR